jgi:hypothetical protein
MSFQSAHRNNENYAEAVFTITNNAFIPRLSFRIVHSVRSSLSRPAQLPTQHTKTRVDTRLVPYHERARAAFSRAVFSCPSPNTTTIILHPNHITRPFRRTPNMGMQSPLHQHLTDRIYDHLIRPISTRTPSRTRPVSPTSPFIPLPASGTFDPTRSTPRTLNTASRKLQRTSREG